MRQGQRVAVIAISLWFVGGDVAFAESVRLTFAPPHNTPVHGTIDVHTRVFDGANPKKPPKVIRWKSEWESVFSGTQEQPRMAARFVSNAVTEDGEPMPGSFWNVVKAFPPMELELDSTGQAQRLLGTEALERFSREMAKAGSGINAHQFTPEAFEAGTLRLWNTMFGSVWALVLGREIPLDTSIDFRARLQVGLPSYDQSFIGSQIPLAGQLKITKGTGNGHRQTYRLDGAYQSDFPLAEEGMRVGLETAMRPFLPALTSQHWQSLRVEGDVSAQFDAATMMITEETLKQRLIVESMDGGAFRLERDTHVENTWKQ